MEQFCSDWTEFHQFGIEIFSENLSRGNASFCETRARIMDAVHEDLHTSLINI
jgi:histidyl-tRNA synthetase